MDVTRTITIYRSPEEVYGFWHDFENLPSFMYHLEGVEVTGVGRSHWVAKRPGGGVVEWDAEIVDDVPNERIAWRSVGDSDDVRNSGSVTFSRAPGDRGTEVRVMISYDAPGGKVGALFAKLSGEEPGQQVEDDLRRFKQVLETGEVVRSSGAPEGMGKPVAKQLAARPATDKELESRT